MNEQQRMEVADKIAEEFPYSFDMTYRVYEIVRKSMTKKSIIVKTEDVIRNTKSVLEFASTIQRNPIGIAITVFGYQDYYDK